MQARELFEILVREQADMLAGYIRAFVRDPGAVDDLFQETLLAAWRKLDTFDRTRPFGPWLRGIAGKQILVYRRRMAHHVALCDEEILEHLNARCDALHRQPGDTLEEKLSLLRDCVSRLPQSFKETVQLTYEQGLKTQPLAEQLRIPLETAKKRLQRARARLLECLGRKLDTANAADTT